MKTSSRPQGGGEVGLCTDSKLDPHASSSTGLHAHFEVKCAHISQNNGRGKQRQDRLKLRLQHKQQLLLTVSVTERMIRIRESTEPVTCTWAKKSFVLINIIIKFDKVKVL